MSKLLNIVCGFVIFVLLFLLFKQCGDNKKSDIVLQEYKERVLTYDSLRKVSDNHYQKLVNDINTEKELSEQLKKENKALYEEIKKEKKQVIAYTSLKAQPEKKVETIRLVPVSDRLKVGEREYKEFDDYYPNKEDYFINYRGRLDVSDNDITYIDVKSDSGELVGTWKFSSLKIGIVVSEKEKGLFHVDLDAPSWLAVKNVEVNTLPLSAIKPDNFDWVIGGAVGKNYGGNMVFGVETGIRIKRSIFSIQGNTDKQVLVGFKRLL